MRSPRGRSALWMAVTFTGSLLGCGRVPTTSQHVTNATPVPKSNFQAPVSAKDQQLVHSVLSAVNVAYNQLQGLSGTIDTVDQQNGHRATGQAKFSFLKPNMTRIDLISNSEHPDQAGTKCYWDGGSTVQVRAGGFLGMVKINLPLTDGRLKSLNGYTIDQLHLNTVIKAMFSPQANIRVLGPAMKGGRQVMGLDVLGVSIAPGVDELRVGVDYATRLPVFFEVYSQGQMTYSLNLTNFSTTPPTRSELQI